MRKVLIVAASLLLFPGAASAQPSRVIIMRHAEKGDAYALCDLGTLRAKALAQQYLGRDASQSLFDGQRPAAMLAMTMHTLETVAPSARTWKMPVTDYAVIPPKKGEKTEADLDENAQTQQAARDLMSDKAYDGKTVLIAWEHHRIADSRLEAKFPRQDVTLRQLLHLDQIADVPARWPGQTYDYFWIVDFKPGQSKPASFRMLRQTFTAPFNTLPSNVWGASEPLHIAAGCMK